MLTLSDKLKQYLIEKNAYLEVYYDRSGYVRDNRTSNKLFTFHTVDQLEELISPKPRIINIDIKIDGTVLSQIVADEISKIKSVLEVKVV